MKCIVKKKYYINKHVADCITVTIYGSLCFHGFKFPVGYAANRNFFIA
jgi:hypothetical protein